MPQFLKNLTFGIAIAVASNSVLAQLPDEHMAAAAAQYKQYCALCHAEDRTGYANDKAPSLKSKSLFALGPMPIFMAAAYGRAGTPMGPYIDDLEGPMSRMEIRRLAVWLSLKADVAPRSPRHDLLEPVLGDIALGKDIYARECAQCHGTNGEGGEGTALGNAAMLATSPDLFLRHAISEGRDGTKMPAFKDKLTADEIDSVTAFLRTRAEGWLIEQPVISKPPTPENYVLNPDGAAPEFNPKNKLYVMSKDLFTAMQNKRRMVLLDTRVPHFWGMANIKGSVPVPYYSDFDTVVENLPDDGTWIVAYCECPRAAAESVVKKLRERGFANTVVLWEGYAGWAGLGYPITVGRVDLAEVPELKQ